MGETKGKCIRKFVTGLLYKLEKSGNLIFDQKIREKSGNFSVLSTVLEKSGIFENFKVSSDFHANFKI